MLPVDHLMLDAKQALLEEQHRKFRRFREEGRVGEAMQQFHATLGCALDLLNYSLHVLEQVLADQQQRHRSRLPAPPSSAD